MSARADQQQSTRIDSPTTDDGSDVIASPGDHDNRWWKATWPLARDEWRRLALAFAVVVAIGAAAGKLLTNWSALGGVIAFDNEVAQQFADGRTDGINSLSHWGAFMADTPVKIVVSVALAGFFLWRFRRWHEAAMIGLPLIFEAAAFMATTIIVGRPRPDVERLLDSPVDTSFPSGHVAAATVYAAVALVVFWHTRAIWARFLALALAVTAPIIVGWARLYQGMHFLTDVIAGMLLGVASVAIARWIIGSPPDAQYRTGSTRAPNRGGVDDIERTAA